MLHLLGILLGMLVCAWILPYVIPFVVLFVVVLGVAVAAACVMRLIQMIIPFDSTPVLPGVTFGINDEASAAGGLALQNLLTENKRPFELRRLQTEGDLQAMLVLVTDSILVGYEGPLLNKYFWVEVSRTSRWRETDEALIYIKKYGCVYPPPFRKESCWRFQYFKNTDSYMGIQINDDAIRHPLSGITAKSTDVPRKGKGRAGDQADSSGLLSLGMKPVMQVPTAGGPR